jgi:acetyl esterase/lipase
MFMTIFVFNTQAQKAIIPLFDDTIPGNKVTGIKETREISKSGSSVISNITKPELWWYQAKAETARPAIIICPGGGYRYEAYEHEGEQVAKWLSDIGYQAFVLKYRLPDENLFSDATYIPLADARQAVALVRKMAKSLSTNPEKVGIMGFSAGGHLAASASTLFNQEIPYAKAGDLVRPDFSILIYPVISMTDELTHKGSREALLGNNPSQKLIDLFSLEKQVSEETPPTFILHAADDRAVPPGNTTTYAKALREKNVKVKEIILPEGGHGFGFRKESPAFEWTIHLSDWLHKTVK